MGSWFNSMAPLLSHGLFQFSNSDKAGEPMSFVIVPKTERPKEIPHDDFTAGSGCLANQLRRPLPPPLACHPLVSIVNWIVHDG